MTATIDTTTPQVSTEPPGGARTVGSLFYRPPVREAGPRAVGTWGIQARPHVAILAKRIFVKARADRAGILLLSDTLDTARMLAWFMDLYPLAMSAPVRERLAVQVEAAAARQVDVAAVLAGAGRSFGVREPARAPMGFYERGSSTPFQVVAAQLACTTGRVLIGDDLGFGKTFSAILALNAPGALPALIVCQAHLPEQISEQIALTLPWLRTHIIKRRDPYTRDADGNDVPYVLSDAQGRDPDVLIISYTKLPSWRFDLTGKVSTVIFDEVQELRHAASEKYRAAAAIADQAQRVIGLSNTPVYNYGEEAFAVVTAIAPGLLGTIEEFRREWCTTSPNGKVILREPAAFGAWLRESGVMIARSYEDIGIYDDDPDWHQDQPTPPGWRPSGQWRALARPVIEPVPVNVDYDATVIGEAMSDAAQMARLVLAQATRDNHTAKFQAAGQLDLAMRQATGVAKAAPVAAYVRMLLQAQDRVVLFGWHRAVYDLWLEHLADFHPVLYTGSEGPKQKRVSKERFCAGDSRILIISLRSGTGLDGLQNHCSDVVFGELDWSPAVQRQGIGRVARGLRRKNTVRAHYLISAGGTDPLMAELLQLKRYMAEPMMSTDGDVIQMGTPHPDRVRMLAQQVLAQQSATEPLATGPDLLTPRSGPPGSGTRPAVKTASTSPAAPIPPAAPERTWQ